MEKLIVWIGFLIFFVAGWVVAYNDRPKKDYAHDVNLAIVQPKGGPKYVVACDSKTGAEYTFNFVKITDGELVTKMEEPQP